MLIRTKLTTIQDVTDFVNVANQSLDEAWVTKDGSRVCINAKSLMGMFSIDTASGFIVDTPDDDIAEFLFKVAPDDTSYLD